jgi:hypothetical protein
MGNATVESTEGSSIGFALSLDAMSVGAHSEVDAGMYENASAYAAEPTIEAK